MMATLVLPLYVVVPLQPIWGLMTSFTKVVVQNLIIAHSIRETAVTGRVIVATTTMVTNALRAESVTTVMSALPFQVAVQPPSMVQVM
jgi:hypothetical protein